MAFTNHIGKRLCSGWSNVHAYSRFIRTTTVLGALLFFTPGFARSESATEEYASALFQFLDEIPGRIARIDSITSSANLTTVVNREYLDQAEDHTQKNQVLFKRAESSVRIDIKQLDPGGEVVDITAWLSNAQQNVFQVDGHASILDSKLNIGKSFIPPYDPIGWIFSFTCDDFLATGYPVVADLTSLSAPEVWQTLNQQADLQSFKKVPGGGFSVVFRKTFGSVEATFRPIPIDGGEQLMPSEVKFSNKAGELIWSGKVTEWQTGEMPTPKSAICTTTVSIPGKKRMRAATWNWSAIESDFHPFNEEDLSFDPMSATEIFDQVTSTTITVPK